VIRHTVEQVHLCFPEHRCCYATINDDGVARVSCAFEPDGMEALDGVSIDLTRAVVYLDTLRRCDTVIADDIAFDERFHSVRGAFGARALLDAPLSQDGELGGVLSFHSAEPHAWSDHEIATLREVARDLAAAIRKAHDREARRRAQDALAASERRLRLALGAGQMVSWECDIASGALTWTPANKHSPGALPGNLDELIERIHAEDREHVLAAIRRACADGSQFQAEYRIETPEGSVQWVESRGEVYRESGDERVILVGISSDISDRRKSEEAVRHRQKLESLGVLAGGVAHDFNNLLTGILGNSTLAAEMVDEDHPAHALMQDVCLAGERAAELTSQLLAYAGRGRYILTPLDLSSLVRDTCRLIQLSIPKKTMLRLDLAQDLPKLQADRGQLQQIIMNLVMNAGEAAGERERPEIRVSTRVAEVDEAWLRRMAPAGGIEPGSYIMLSVEDNGAGMDESVRARIFDPFFTTKSTGRGLGLAAVHGIVRAHHGGLAVTSAPGWGTVFEVLFPAAQAAEPRSSGSRAILVIAEDDAVRREAAAILESTGYTVVATGPGSAAMDALRDRREIAAVLLDKALAETLREVQRVRPELPVLLADREFGPHEAREWLSRVSSGSGMKAAAADAN
jgi:signal transduction histidine kinase